MREKICPVCHGIFQTNRRKVYCSRTCGNTGRQRTPAAKARRLRYAKKYPEKISAYRNAWRQKKARREPWLNMLQLAAIRAKKRNLNFDLTEKWAKERWTGFCEISGLEFVRRNGPGSLPLTPSLDRIMPSKGYVMDNCRFILFALNSMKCDGDDETMRRIATALLYQRPE